MLSQYNVALMHVVNHAFFKALLFLGAGAIIHSVSDQQDVRRLGGLIKFLPFIYSCMLVGTIALLGLPWLSGFYSKDLIIELAYSRYSFSSTYAYILGSITAGLTAFYSFRLISLVFLSYPNAPRQTYLNVHEASMSVIIPLSVLSLFSIFFGFVFSDLFVGLGTDFFGNSVFIHPNNTSLIEAEFSLPLVYKLLPGILSLIGATIAIFEYHQKYASLLTESLENSKLVRNIYTFLNGKYFFDILYNHYIITQGYKIGYTISKVFDRGVIESLGPYGLAKVFYSSGDNISKLDTGIITTYSLYITMALLSLLFLVCLTPLFLETSSVVFNEMRLLIIYLAALIVALCL